MLQYIRTRTSFFLLLFFEIISSNLYSQSIPDINPIKIPLSESSFINIPFVYSSFLTRPSFEIEAKFKLPNNILKYRILESHLQFRQYLFNKLFIQKQEIKELKNEFDVIKNDTVKYSKDFINESVKLLIYYDENYRKKLVIDCDNDFDFTNDIAYDITDSNKKLFSNLIIQVKNIEIWDAYLQRKKTINVQITPDLYNYHYKPVVV